MSKSSGSTVHPRACGEHRVPESTVYHGRGSSPRVRGTQRKTRRRRCRLRFIPARAGNTRIFMCGHIHFPVHPRACGEHAGGLGTVTVYFGSSPRVRGTPRGRLHGRLQGRFIPARAGNTYSTIDMRSFATVHPRACGEHGEGHPGFFAHCGSSPRVRGTPQNHRDHDGFDRFIPARAGNTIAGTSEVTVVGVHPRACGEHTLRIIAIRAGAGSSPRVRGTRHHSDGRRACRRFIPARAGNTQVARLQHRLSAVHPRAWRGTHHHHPRRGQQCRFIPARAGNTKRTRLSAIPSPVHPRACGEHLEQARDTVFDNGSSPRVRGTRRRHGCRGGHRRFIPARAGNTSRHSRSGERSSVHPRACGEHTGTHEFGHVVGGSSPRVRGTLVGNRVGDAFDRFIPARAGNTRMPDAFSVITAVHPRACGEHLIARR